MPDTPEHRDGIVLCANCIPEQLALAWWHAIKGLTHWGALQLLSRTQWLDERRASKLDRLIEKLEHPTAKREVFAMLRHFVSWKISEVGAHGAEGGAAIFTRLLAELQRLHKDSLRRMLISVLVTGEVARRVHFACRKEPLTIPPRSIALWESRLCHGGDSAFTPDGATAIHEMMDGTNKIQVANIALHYYSGPYVSADDIRTEPCEVADGAPAALYDSSKPRNLDPTNREHIDPAQYPRMVLTPYKTLVPEPEGIDEQVRKLAGAFDRALGL